MEIKNLILIIIGSFNIIIGLLVILRNSKSLLNWNFGLLLISIFGWSLSLAMSRELAMDPSAIIWSKTSYYFAIFIGFFILNFSFSYPYRKKIKTWQKVLIYIPFLFVLYILCRGNLLIISLDNQPWGYDVSFRNFWYFMYSIIFLFFMTWSYINLLKSYFTSSGYLKSQIKIVLVGLFLGGLFGAIFDLVLPYFGNWKLNWFGPYFTIFILLIISYLLFYKKNITNG